MKFLKAVWAQIERFGRWMNANATKRWLLALDRCCICWLFTVAFEQFRGVMVQDDGLTSFDLLFVCVLLLFLILYVPSYMFPGSDKPVGHCSGDDCDALSVDEKKEP